MSDINSTLARSELKMEASSAENIVCCLDFWVSAFCPCLCLSERVKKWQKCTQNVWCAYVLPSVTEPKDTSQLHFLYKLPTTDYLYVIIRKQILLFSILITFNVPQKYWKEERNKIFLKELLCKNIFSNSHSFPTFLSFFFLHYLMWFMCYYAVIWFMCYYAVICYVKPLLWILYIEKIKEWWQVWWSWYIPRYN